MAQTSTDEVIARAEQAQSGLGSAALLTTDPALLKAIDRAYESIRDLRATVAWQVARLKELEQELTETRRGRVGDSETIGRLMCELEAAGVGPTHDKIELRRLDTPDNRAFWASVSLAREEWERSKLQWARDLENRKAGVGPTGSAFVCVCGARFQDANIGMAQHLIDTRGQDGHGIERASWGPTEALRPYVQLAQEMRDDMSKFASMVAALSGRPEQWQSIETAPTNGEPVLAVVGREVTTVCWIGEDVKMWVFADDGCQCEPTYWMPFPNAPALSVRPTPEETHT